MNVLALLEHRSEKLVGPLEASDADAAVITVDRSRGFVRGYFRALWQTRRTILQEDPDVLVGDHAGVESVLILCLGFLYGRPSVIRLGGNPVRLYRERYRTFKQRRVPWQWLKYVVLRLIAATLYRYASGFIVVSEDLKQQIAPLVRCETEQIAVVPPPIDSERFATADGCQWRERFGDDRLVVTVTNLAFKGKYAGVRDTVAALAPVLKSDPKIRYLVAGDGLYADQLETHIGETYGKAVRDHIELLGFVEDIESLYTVADVVVYVSDVDGYPNVVREAQAAGKTVVATASYGVAEQIDDGQDGVLVERSPDAIREAVERLLADDSERERLGTTAADRVKAENNPAALGRVLHDALARLQ